MAEIVFVSGTLTRGLPLEAEMRRARGKFLGLATIRGDLYDLGAYPAAVPGRGTVHGELYLVPKSGLAHLDRVEGSEYHRHRAVVRSQRGGKLSAWVYFYRRQPPAARRLQEGAYAGPKVGSELR